MSDLKELLAQREQLEAQLAAAFKEERINVLDEVIRKMKLHRITLDEIRGPVPAAAMKVAPKYRDPVSGREWSGRGKPPNWIKDVVDRTKYLISG
jgi:DNA-binding protein H-NS